jgi:hypothetical protein
MTSSKADLAGWEDIIDDDQGGNWSKVTNSRSCKGDISGVYS